MRFDSCSERVYSNAANLPLLELLGRESVGRVLDCGCGAGDNARELARTGWEVVGITISRGEQGALSECGIEAYVQDLEGGITSDIEGSFSVVLFSHVLEHLIRPERVLRDAMGLLQPGGRIAVALPNVLNLRERLHFLLGRFEYQEAGILDNTHVRFYTFESGRRLLESNGFSVIRARAHGGLPLRAVRSHFPSVGRYLDRSPVKRAIDGFLCRLWPGLFGWQLLYVAVPEHLPKEVGSK